MATTTVQQSAQRSGSPMDLQLDLPMEQQTGRRRATASGLQLGPSWGWWSAQLLAPLLEQRWGPRKDPRWDPSKGSATVVASAVPLEELSDSLTAQRMDLPSVGQTGSLKAAATGLLTELLWDPLWGQTTAAASGWLTAIQGRYWAAMSESLKDSTTALLWDPSTVQRMAISSDSSLVNELAQA